MEPTKRVSMTDHVHKLVIKCLHCDDKFDSSQLLLPLQDKYTYCTQCFHLMSKYVGDDFILYLKCTNCSHKINLENKQDRLSLGLDKE
jgi:DNA-directed RNA polymerase subunit RPC12/RpoP